MGARILLICTANVCRSVHAAAQIRAVLAAAEHRSLPNIAQGPEPLSEVEVVSAGVFTQTGWPACPFVVARAAGGTDVAEHRARRLSAADVAAASVILTAAADHRAAAVRLVPSAANRAFTLREAAALAPLTRAMAAESDGSIAAFASALDRVRGLRHPKLDIEDGHGRSGRRHRKALDQIEDASAAIAAEILAWRAAAAHAQ